MSQTRRLAAILAAECEGPLLYRGPCQATP